MSDYFEERAKMKAVGASKDPHSDSDVDSDRNAQHHTLGTRPNQAAPGNSPGLVAVGGMILWGGGALPANYAVPTGQYLERSDYPALFKQYSTTHGTTTGTNFRLPTVAAYGGLNFIVRLK
jgi:hypothetical protein